MSRYLAKWSAAPPAAFTKAQVNSVALTFKSLLSYPCVDLAGDYVNPAGCNFEPHQREPSIDLEHSRHPIIKGYPVCWACEDFERAEAPYSVTMTSLDFGTEGKPDYHDVPIGTEFYKSSCPISMQVFAMRESGALPASSLEFALVPGCYKAIGWSALEGRKAYHFDRVAVQRWTVCKRGVNPGALLVLDKSASAPTQVPGELEKILADRRVNVGGTSEPLHEVIYKALQGSGDRDQESGKRKAMPAAPYAAPQAAMPAPDPALQTQADTAAEEEQKPASGGVSAKLEFCQAVSDAIEMYRQNMQSSDHPGLRAAAEQDIKEISAKLAKIQARAQKHDAKLNGSPATDIDTDTEGGDDGADAEDESATDDTDTGGEADSEDEIAGKKKKPPFGKALEVDEYGVVAVPRPVYRKAVWEGRVKRFSLADMPLPALPQPAPVTKAPPGSGVDPEELEALKRELAALAKNVRLAS